MFGVLGWMLFGLIVGAVAKLVMPGRDPGGVIVTMLLGMAGGFLGGYVGRAVGIYDGMPVLALSVLGSIVLLAAYRVFHLRHRPRPPAII